MKLKTILKFVFATLLFVTFSQINGYAAYMPTITPENVHHDEYMHFSETKVNHSAKRNIPEDEAHILSKKVIAKICNYNKHKKNTPRIQVYTTKSVSKNGLKAYLKQQSQKKNHYLIADDNGEINYLISTKDNTQYTMVHEGAESFIFTMSAKSISNNTQKYINNKQYDKVIDQIINNVNKEQTKRNHRSVAITITRVIFLILAAITIIYR